MTHQHSSGPWKHSKAATQSNRAWPNKGLIAILLAGAALLVAIYIERSWSEANNTLLTFEVFYG